MRKRLLGRIPVALTRAPKASAFYKINAKSAWSLYGRGIDKVREHNAAEGQSDMDQAIAIWPQIADEIKRRGITP